MKNTLLYILCCWLFSGAIWAQENDSQARIATIENNLEVLKLEVPGLAEKVNVNVSNTSLSNFLLAVSQIHKVNLNVAEELKTINIVNGFNDVSVKDLLVFLAKEYELGMDFTGNIISVKKYVKPIKEPEEQPVNVSFDPNSKLISMDVSGEPASKVFRRIMDVSSKNVLYAPAIKDQLLQLYINKVSFEVAMEKLALSNNLELTISNDGFYVFGDRGGETTLNVARNNRKGRRPIRRQSDFYYKVLDTVAKTVEVDFKDTSIADIVYTLADDFKVNIFTASPIESAGKATFKTNKITFDKLLEKIFEASGNAVRASSNSRDNDDYNASQPSQSLPSSGSGNFTFKKEGNVYYFGYENQLSLKSIELVPMMHRSIELLGDASSSGGFGNNGGGLNSGGINFFGGGSNSINSSGNSGFDSQGNSNFNSRGTTNSFSNRNSSFSNGGSFGGNGTTSASSNSGGAITSLFPAEVLNGLDVKVDTELNGFVVSGSSSRIEKFKNFVNYIDKPVPVILIEVMILEVSRTATVDTGVEFGLRDEPTTDEGTSFPSTDLTLGAKTVNRIIGGFDGFGSLNLGKVVPNFYLNIKAMETNGNLKILSTPKLSTLNGHKAYLSSGQTTYYEVTNQNFFGSQIPQTSQVTNFQSINAELAIEFKPYVSGDGQLTLDIQVIQSSFGQRIADGAPPDINSRRFSSIIRMKDKDVAILGGIEEKIKNDAGSGVPLLSRIPVLKWLFSQRNRQDTKRKLNILIKPTIFY